MIDALARTTDAAAGRRAGPTAFPFTAALTADGLLSYGIDPPNLPPASMAGRPPAGAQLASMDRPLARTPPSSAKRRDEPDHPEPVGFYATGPIGDSRASIRTPGLPPDLLFTQVGTPAMTTFVGFVGDRPPMSASSPSRICRWHCATSSATWPPGKRGDRPRARRSRTPADPAQRRSGDTARVFPARAKPFAEAVIALASRARSRSERAFFEEALASAAALIRTSRYLVAAGDFRPGGRRRRWSAPPETRIGEFEIRRALQPLRRLRGVPGCAPISSRVALKLGLADDAPIREEAEPRASDPRGISAGQRGAGNCSVPISRPTEPYLALRWLNGEKRRGPCRDDTAPGRRQKRGRAARLGRPGSPKPMPGLHGPAVVSRTATSHPGNVPRRAQTAEMWLIDFGGLALLSRPAGRDSSEPAARRCAVLLRTGNTPRLAWLAHAPPRANPGGDQYGRLPP